MIPETNEHPVTIAEDHSATVAPSLASVARWMLIIVCGFYLLRELGVILKPLFVAVLLAYVIIPIHQQVKKRVPSRLVLITLVTMVLLILGGLSFLLQSSTRTLLEEFPTLSLRAKTLATDLQTFSAERFPSLSRVISDLMQSEQGSEVMIRDWIGRLAGVAAETASQAVVVGLYLMFLLLEAGRFPMRVRSAFSDQRAERIMETVAGINRGIADYLRAKVNASLVLAVPVFVLLFVFGTRFALVWAVINFLANFVPYLGSVIGYSLPTLYALLQFGFGWEFFTIAAMMLVIHVVTSTVVEPAIIGKAVGVSPLVILIALSFWGYSWGLTGMFLAVPLTVIAKITCAHVEATRPLAKLVSDE